MGYRPFCSAGGIFPLDDETVGDLLELSLVPPAAVAVAVAPPAVPVLVPPPASVPPPPRLLLRRHHRGGHERREGILVRVEEGILIDGHFRELS